MSTEQATQTTNTSSQASAPAPESANTGGQATPTPEGTAQAASAAAPAASAYTPNYKFKAYGEEKEFDEWVRPMVNEKTEKQIREVFEKAYGLDGLKPKYQKLQEDHNSVSEKFQTLNGNVEYLQTLVGEKDFGTFFDTLQIPRAEIARWVLQELKYQNMSPEEKAAIDNQRQKQVEARQYREESSTWKQKYEAQAIEHRQSLLQAAVQDPSVQDVVKAFDTRAGEAGAFQREVLLRGYYANQQGKDPSAQELVQEVIKLYGLSPEAAKPAAPAPAAATTAEVVDKKKALPTIPNVQSSSTAPTKKVFKSLDEIRKHAQAMG